MSELQPAPPVVSTRCAEWRPSGSRTGVADVWQRHGQTLFALALVVCEDADVGYRDIASLTGESPAAVAEPMRSGLIEAGRRDR